MRFPGVVLLTLSLQACGEPAQPAQPGGDTYWSSQGGRLPDDEPAREVTTVYRQDGGRLSLVVKNAADLPICDVRTAGTRAYIEPAEVYFKCEDGDWVELPTEEALPKEEAEEKSDHGTDSDPIEAPSEAGLRAIWILGALGSFTEAERACPDRTRLPTIIELQNASLMGLMRDQDEGSWWTQTLDPDDPEASRLAIVRRDDGSFDIEPRPKTARLGIVCLREDA